jgi:hypothetical protein
MEHSVIREGMLNVAPNTTLFHVPGQPLGRFPVSLSTGYVLVLHATIASLTRSSN